MTTTDDGDPLDVALSHPEPPDAPSSAATTSSTDVVVAAERLVIGTEWVVSGRVRVRRRVVTERRTIEVEVRREVIELTGDHVDFRGGRLVGTMLDGPTADTPTTTAPFTAVLREEVPRVVLDVRPYERLTVTTTRVQDDVTVHDTVAHEEIDLVTFPGQPGSPR